MRIYSTKDFSREARRSRLKDDDLIKAALRADKGLIDARIGAHLVKQRVGRKGGYRTIIVLKQAKFALFLHLFAKQAKADLTPVEEEVFREAAKHLAELSDMHVRLLVERGEWIEIEHESREEDLSE